jgi:hypothetical protein
MPQLLLDTVLERGYSPALQPGFAPNFNPPAEESNLAQSGTEDAQDQPAVEESCSQIVVRSEFRNILFLNSFTNPLW